MFKNILLIVIIGMTISACGLLNPVPSPEIHYYQLNLLNNSVDSSCSNGGSEVLQITHAKVDAPFDTTTMYYSDSEYELRAYGVHQWVALPGQMLTQAIQQKILASCQYRSVVSDDFITVAHYRLTSQIVEEKQIINGSEAKIKLVIISQLVDNTSNKVIKGKTFDIELSTTPNVSGYVTGVNQATSMYLDQLVDWINK